MENSTPTFDETIDIITKVSAIHERQEKSVYHETTAMEQQALSNIDRLIEAGDVELYVLKALLSACNNWSTYLIVRMGEFQSILLEGIDRGCLAPGNDYAWDIMGVAAVNNDPAEFMTDMTRYYSLLADAAESGNDTAWDIMNTIWEPEQIIEED